MHSLRAHGSVSSFICDLIRGRSAFKAKPNAAHYALAWLSLPENRLAVAPQSTSFHIITQNVDGLSLKAAHASSDPESALSNIIEMHGAIADIICTKCGHRETNTSSPICAALAGTEAQLLQPDKDEKKIPVEDLPRCKQPECGGLLRPAVVWFGEEIDQLPAIEELVEAADMCLVIGTSSTVSNIFDSGCCAQLRLTICLLDVSEVHPAAGFAFEVQDNGGQVAVFNLDRSDGDDEADFLFLGPCEETLPKILGSPTVQL